MTTAVTILRELWRRRIAVGIFALMAIVIVGLIAYKASFPPESRRYQVGEAETRILVDTPSSQVVAIDPKNGGDLGAQASLLANLMADGEAKSAIARYAGVDPRRLVTVARSDAGRSAPRSRPTGPRDDVLSIGTLTNDSGDPLPIIDVQAHAATVQRAAALANAAVAGLSDYLASKAAADGVKQDRRIRVRALGPAQARIVSKGSGLILALVAGVGIFCALCGFLILLDALAKGWREAAAAERCQVLRSPAGPAAEGTTPLADEVETTDETPAGDEDDQGAADGARESKSARLSA